MFDTKSGYLSGTFLQALFQPW